MVRGHPIIDFGHAADISDARPHLNKPAVPTLPCGASAGPLPEGPFQGCTLAAQGGSSCAGRSALAIFCQNAGMICEANSPFEGTLGRYSWLT